MRKRSGGSNLTGQPRRSRPEGPRPTSRSSRNFDSPKNERRFSGRGFSERRDDGGVKQKFGTDEGGFKGSKPKKQNEFELLDEPDLEALLDDFDDKDTDDVRKSAPSIRRISPSTQRRKTSEIDKRESRIALRRKNAAGVRPDMPFDERELRYRDYIPPHEREKALGKKKKNVAVKGEIRLNRYIALSGHCARRQADLLIEAGKVRVNGEIVTTLGTKVNVKTDKVEVGGKILKPEKPIYILLNKPKNYLTTLSDPEGRPTVMEIVQAPGGERIFPVGRLDRNTTGVLLLTNDGELAKKLTHPSHKVKKVYRVYLDKPLTHRHLVQLTEGVKLEDGDAAVDAIYHPDPSDRKEVIVEIHSGRNRLVRRMFEALEYQVERLDRTEFGPLSKKGLPRGRYRLLTEQEIGFLKMI